MNGAVVLEGKIMRKYKMFVLYYIVGMLASLGVSAFPLIYANRGFDPGQIALLISVSYIASLIQPILGHITDTYLTNLKMAKIIFTMLVVSSMGMYLASSLFLIFVIINAMMRTGLISFIDGYVTTHQDQFEFSYGKMRSSIPIGFGSGLFLTFGMIFILGAGVEASLLIFAMAAIIALVIINSIEDLQVNQVTISRKIDETEDNYDWLGIILLVAFSLLYSGLFQISNAYLSLYYAEYGYTTIIIGALSLLMLVPQIALMIGYDKILGKMKKTNVLLIGVAIGMIQSLIYYIFPNSILMLIIASFLCGIQLVIFPASFFPLFTKALKQSRISTGLTSKTTVLCVWVALLNTFVIGKIYANSGSSRSVYIVICLVMLISILPLYSYKLTHKLD